jgi:hypothetical protein
MIEAQPAVADLVAETEETKQPVDANPRREPARAAAG